MRSGSRRRWWLALVLVLVAVVPGSALGEAPGGEAWFPTGLGAVTAPTYPEGTLHVGAVGGVETDRTYLRFDGLDEDVTAAVLTVPFAADAGTTLPETAVVAACEVPGGLDGTPDAPPEVDCEGAPVASVTPEALTVDVTPLILGDTLTVALVPVEGTWHLGFDSRDREGGTPADLAVSALTPNDVTPTTVAPAGRPAPPPSGSSPTFVAPPITVPPAASPGAAIAEQASPPAAPPALAPAAPIASTGGGFDYPIVFALPLVLLVVLAVAGEGLTRPVRLREETSS